MNRDPILFRVDGTPTAGVERLNRCLVFAAALQRRRRPIYFLSQLDPAHLAFRIKKAGNEWLEADGPAGSEEDLSETLQEIRRLKPAAIVVDSPTASECYLSELVAGGTLVVSMDHLGGVRLASQLIVNPLLDPGKEAYDFTPGSQLLLGRRYALVRPEVRRVRQVRAQEPAQPFRVVVAVGEEEHPKRALAVARLLLPISRLAHIDLLTRPQSPSLEPFLEFAAAHAGRVEVAFEPADVASRIARCHLAITGGGAWSLELACVGVPQLIVVQCESYWPTARRLEDEGAAVCVSSHENLAPAAMRQAIQELLGDSLERQAMSRCARKLIDGRGPDRLVTALEIMLHPSRTVEMRDAA
jgi:spore coat polysaccharide biosynthesis predicted glycosyltransferase SpsG